MNGNVMILDLSGCKHIGEIHYRIKETFDFPDYYGENWHAFKDAFITVGVPNKIEVRGISSVPEKLKDEIDKMISTLDSMKRELLNYGFEFEYALTD